jgi:hypothetical protein
MEAFTDTGVAEEIRRRGTLDSHEPERRSADGRNVQRSLENGMDHAAAAHAIGFAPENGRERPPRPLRLVRDAHAERLFPGL